MNYTALVGCAQLWGDSGIPVIVDAYCSSCYMLQLNELRSIGCSNDALCTAAAHVYIELCEGNTGASTAQRRHILSTIVANAVLFISQSGG